ncbi:hypothetical protein Cfor_11247, partial [Coptotermes formosanus]
TVADDENQCANGCRCNDNSANCSHLGIGVVPHWDSFNVSLVALDLTGNALDSLDEDALTGYVSVRNMSFRNNAIKSVHRTAFQGLSEGLVYLDLSDNVIRTVDSETFTFIPKLEVLLMSNNSIAVLNSAVFSDLTRLRHLDVSLNHLSGVSDGTFEGNGQLEFLSLRHNGIQSISKSTFRGQRSLKHLDLSQNSIRVIERGAFSALSQLEWLSLSQNNVKKVDTGFCESIKQVLYLNLSGNIIDFINSQSFTKCSQLETLSIAHNNVSELPQQALYGLFNLTHLDVSHNRLTHFGPEVFAGVTSEMSVSGTGSTEHHDSSAVCAQYRSLYRDLKFLELDNNEITSLDQCVFAPTRSLQVIDMAANNLSALDYRIFLPLKNVSSFDISCNRLNTVDRQTAQWILETDTAVNLTGNPWRCDCGAVYTFYRMSREGTGKNLTLRCENPAELRGESWDILEEKCRPTVTPQLPTISTVTKSTVKTRSRKISQPFQFSTTDQRDVSFEESSPGNSPSTPARLVLSLSMLAVAVYIVALALIVTTRQYRVTCGNDSDRTRS